MESSLLLWGSLLALLIYLLYRWSTKNWDFWDKRGVLRLELDSAFTRIFVKQSTFLDLDYGMYKQMENLPYGCYMEMDKPVLLIRDLECVKQVYVKDFDHFVNRRNFNSPEPHWNLMLFNQLDQEWKDLRATMSPTFSTGKIRRMYPIINECNKRLITFLKDSSVKNDGIVNLEDVLGNYAMDVLSCAAFGIESGVFKDPNSIVSRMAKKLQMKFTPIVILKFFAGMISPFLAKLVNFRIIDSESDEYFTKLLMDSIKYREKSGEKRDDFLQLMIETKNGGLQSDKDKDSEEMDTYEKDAQLSLDKKRKVEIDDDVIVANCILFIFGGFDTTQSALLFAAYALALNTDIQELLRREVEDAAENNGGEITYDMVNQLQYLDKVINETLRMYPPILRNERTCTKDYTLPNSNVVIPKGSGIGIPTFQIHHDEKHFPNPEVFDPERFSPEVKAQRHPYAFMPFGHGPRNCVANRFALTETKAAIANLVLHFEIEPCAKTTIPIQYLKTNSLKPIDGMWLKLNPRK